MAIEILFTKLRDHPCHSMPVCRTTAMQECDLKNKLLNT
jgi:hypothetical protein